METIQKLSKGTQGKPDTGYKQTGVDYANLKDVEKIALLKQLYSAAEQKGLPILPYGDRALTMDPVIGSLDDVLGGPSLSGGYVPLASMQSKGIGPVMPVALTPWAHAYEHSKEPKDPFVQQLVEHKGIDAATKILDAYNILQSDGKIDDKVSMAYQLLTGETADSLYAKAEKHGLDIKGSNIKNVAIHAGSDGAHPSKGVHPRYAMALVERSTSSLSRGDSSNASAKTYSKGSGKN